MRKVINEKVNKFAFSVNFKSMLSSWGSGPMVHTCKSVLRKKAESLDNFMSSKVLRKKKSIFLKATTQRFTYT